MGVSGGSDPPGAGPPGPGLARGAGAGAREASWPVADGPQSLTVASIVSRRIGRMFSDLARGTGMHRIRRVARIYHFICPVRRATDTQILSRHTGTKGNRDFKGSYRRIRRARLVPAYGRRSVSRR
jgi:hypothetical protein